MERNDNLSVMRLRAVALASVLTVPSAVICDDLIRFALSAEAHSCCASTDGACARLSTPDECCRTRERATSRVDNTLVPDSRVRTTPERPDAPLVVLQAPALRSLPASRDLDARDYFKRPHDPPHLHPFPLLI
jgi:hypothetical protein